jgi:hypothetical protein
VISALRINFVVQFFMLPPSMPRQLRHGTATRFTVPPGCTALGGNLCRAHSIHRSTSQYRSRHHFTPPYNLQASSMSLPCGRYLRLSFLAMAVCSFSIASGTTTLRRSARSTSSDGSYSHSEPLLTRIPGNASSPGVAVSATRSSSAFSRHQYHDQGIVFHLLFSIGSCACQQLNVVWLIVFLAAS